MASIIVGELGRNGCLSSGLSAIIAHCVPVDSHLIGSSVGAASESSGISSVLWNNSALVVECWVHKMELPSGRKISLVSGRGTGVISVDVNTQPCWAGLS